MSHLASWLALVASVIAYRLIVRDTTVSPEEHVVWLYFSGFALLIHWIASRDVKRNRDEK